MMSLGVFFSIVIAVLSQTLPQAITKGLLLQHLPAVVVAKVAALPPTSSLFAALLGFNPLSQLLPAPVLAALPKHNRAVILSQHFFPSLIGTPFMHGLSTAFMISLLLSAIAAVSSWLRGRPQSVEEWWSLVFFHGLGIRLIKPAFPKMGLSRKINHKRIGESPFMTKIRKTNDQMSQYVLMMFWYTQDEDSKWSPLFLS